MKKTLLLGLLLASGLGANAQLADGTQAPDFTATDLDGVTHHLQDYLDAGKTVILDLSASWCGPCWNYHNGHALDDIYNSYGDGASGEVVVLFIEADPGTSVESLYGYNVASDVSTTQGNWVEGTPYPIINDTGEIETAYALTYFPTIYKICPDGVTTLIGQLGAAAIKTSINSSCVTTPLAGVQNSPSVTAPLLRLCENTGVVKAKMKNFGANKITTATLVLEQGGSVIATKEYTGNLAQFSTANITFPSANFDPSQDYDVRASVVNGTTAYNPETAMEAFDVNVAPYTINNVDINVYTDSWPAEISWSIKNSAGTVVASGGPYEGNGQNAGGADANQVITTTLSIPEGTMDCYSLTMNDVYGDGWSLGTQDFSGIRITNAAGLVGEFNGDVSFSTQPFAGAFKTTGSLNTAANSLAKFAVYPNPTTGVLNFSTTEPVSVTVTDLTGKTVFTAANINNGDSINLNNLAKGMYIAQVKGATTQTVQKIVVE